MVRHAVALLWPRPAPTGGFLAGAVYRTPFINLLWNFLDHHRFHLWMLPVDIEAVNVDVSRATSCVTDVFQSVGTGCITAYVTRE